MDGTKLLIASLVVLVLFAVIVPLILKSSKPAAPVNMEADADAINPPAAVPPQIPKKAESKKKSKRAA